MIIKDTLNISPVFKDKDVVYIHIEDVVNGLAYPDNVKLIMHLRNLISLKGKHLIFLLKDGDVIRCSLSPDEIDGYYKNKKDQIETLDDKEEMRIVKLLGIKTVLAPIKGKELDFKEESIEDIL